ncbi:MAG: RelA/SpoT domain-containing protein, partial [Candidatus Micrarchaeota archaeon]
MVWETLKYKKEEINNAGKILTSDKEADEQKLMAMEILNNWRSAHSYPMHIFQMTLKKKSQDVDKKSLVSQRLKRVPAIIYKLMRKYNGRRPSMKLYQMQDIGGCRAVLSNVALAKKLYNEEYLRGDLKHKLVNKKDYISEPKTDGYRSLHLVYEYKSDKGKEKFNGLLTEIQIRSKLQHLWATAVETAGFFTRQAIKSNEGPEWIDFFRLVSSAFAKTEECPCVPDTPGDEKELYSQIKNKERELKVIDKMKAWTSAMRYFEQKIKAKTKKKAKFFLLELDIVGEKLNITEYAEKEEEKAIGEY